MAREATMTRKKKTTKKTSKKKATKKKVGRKKKERPDMPRLPKGFQISHETSVTLIKATYERQVLEQKHNDKKRELNLASNALKDHDANINKVIAKEDPTGTLYGMLQTDEEEKSDDD
mgnify:FL=1